MQNILTKLGSTSSLVHQNHTPTASLSAATCASPPCPWKDSYENSNIHCLRGNPLCSTTNTYTLHSCTTNNLQQIALYFDPPPIPPCIRPVQLHCTKCSCIKPMIVKSKGGQAAGQSLWLKQSDSSHLLTKQPSIPGTSRVSPAARFLCPGLQHRRPRCCPCWRRPRGCRPASCGPVQVL